MALAGAVLWSSARSACRRCARRGWCGAPACSRACWASWGLSLALASRSWPCLLRQLSHLWLPRMI